MNKAPKLAGVYVVGHFQDNIRRRGGVPVNGSVKRFRPRVIEEPGAKRPILFKSGNTVDSIRITGISMGKVRVGINQPSIAKYAAMHQNGGTIRVTPAMKKFFWAMFYKASGNVKTNKNGQASKTTKSQQYSKYAGMWKAMALKKVGSKIRIPQREFMKLTPDIEKGIAREFQYELNKILNLR